MVNAKIRVILEGKNKTQVRGGHEDTIECLYIYCYVSITFKNTLGNKYQEINLTSKPFENCWKHHKHKHKRHCLVIHYIQIEDFSVGERRINMIDKRATNMQRLTKTWSSE